MTAFELGVRCCLAAKGQPPLFAYRLSVPADLTFCSGPSGQWKASASGCIHDWTCSALQREVCSAKGFSICCAVTRSVSTTTW